MSPTIITTGSWTSPLLDISLGKFTTDFTGYWGKLRFKYEPGDSSSSMAIDILDSSDNTLQSNITQTDEGDGYFTCDLSQYTNVREVDCKVKINLTATTKSPEVSELEVMFDETTIS